MSEQEKKSGGAADQSMVLVEQSATSRHKQPIRSMEMQEDAPKELQHKRSKAPAVPSLTEELKDSANTEKKGKTESDRAASSEKQKHNVAKKLSSVTKRRSSSPDALLMTALATDLKKESVSPSQPIPPQVSPSAADSSLAAKHRKKTKDDEDSISEDIADLRTPEVAKVSEEWIDDTGNDKKKGVSWNDDEYLSKGTTAKPCMLERKSSLGPCYRVAAPFGRPSGIAINLAKRCANPEMEDYKPAKSMISISLSKRCLVNKRIYREPYIFIQTQKKNIATIPSREQKDIFTPRGNFLSTLKEKMSNIGEKIKKPFT